jgi:plasmid stability protein
VKLQIRDIDEATHRRAKILAAHLGISLNAFLRDAIGRECNRIAEIEQNGIVGELAAKAKKKTEKKR